MRCRNAGELGNLNISSRPTKRKQTKGIQDMRAIPWIFAWTQNRSILPSWLGIGTALSNAIEQGYLADLQQMYKDWPFFKSIVDLVEMVLEKADMRISRRYEEKLCTDVKAKEIGQEIRTEYDKAVKAVLAITQHSTLLEESKQLKHLIRMRSPFVNIINMLQIEILRRIRHGNLSSGEVSRLRDALLITINGVAAGSRNTG